MEPRSIQAANHRPLDANSGTVRSTSFGSALAAAPSAPVTRPSTISSTVVGPAEPMPSAIAEPMRALREDERALENALNAAASGRASDADDLLELQATVYRYSLRVELATRMIDRAAQGVRQLVTMQV